MFPDLAVMQCKAGYRFCLSALLAEEEKSIEYSMHATQCQWGKGCENTQTGVASDWMQPMFSQQFFPSIS